MPPRDTLTPTDPEAYVKIVRRLKETVEKMSLEAHNDATELLEKSDKFNAYLNKNAVSRDFVNAAASLYLAIAVVQRKIILSFRDAERKRRKESLNLVILYLFEILAFVSTLALIWYGLICNVDVGRLLVCLGGSLISFCALLFFHVREYGRVEKIVGKILARALRLSSFEDEYSQATRRLNQNVSKMTRQTKIGHVSSALAKHDLLTNSLHFLSLSASFAP